NREGGEGPGYLVVAAHPPRCDATGQGRYADDNDPLGTLHEAVLALYPQSFRTRPRVADHHASDQRYKSEQAANKIVMRHQVITDAQKKDQLAVSVQYRVVQCSERRAHIAQPRHLPVEHIEQTGKKDQRAGPADIGQVAPATL